MISEDWILGWRLCCKEHFRISLASNSARELPFWIVCACERVTSTVLQVSIVLVESRLGSLSKRSWRLLTLRPIISLARRREVFRHFGSVFGQTPKPVQFNGNSICSDFNSKMFESWTGQNLFNMQSVILDRYIIDLIWRKHNLISINLIGC